MVNFIISAATFTAVLLLFGAWRLSKRGGAAKQIWLMVAAALVIFVNLAIWITPVDNGQSLLNQTAIETRR